MDNYTRTRRIGGFSSFTNLSFTSPMMIIIYILVVLFLFYMLFSWLNPKSSSSVSKVAGVSNSKVEIAPAKATQNLDREFNFPLRNEKGDEIGKIKYFIKSAELRDEIVVKGKKATAIKGKTFLILNLEISNDNSKNISMETSDYIRLVVNGNDKKQLPPIIHNDPVIVPAISTKETRLGFSIDEADKDLKVKVGEIKGTKTDIALKF